ncbi:Rieske (2Fe-2S) protein [Paenibacillus agricola]|uniref:Rieske (2Fe-2S) protein n=1 Tax=Paenibacillus agricola TaxID=2716264 RepID=A0ABX0JFF4_9BACL|nr:Rieske (2Fe-2S) protein [Paenibacillus agricola]NHN34120.1 Rieske (2Fe-2S) protein [Paenibacillus agricola]
MGRHLVCSIDELPPDNSKIVTLEGRSIGIFNIKGTYYALKNSCPHQSAQLCKGKVMGVMLPSGPDEYTYGREGEIIRCPWHGWEFDITNGKSIFDPSKCLVKTYDVEVVSQDAEESLTVETYPITMESGWIAVTI